MGTGVSPSCVSPGPHVQHRNHGGFSRSGLGFPLVLQASSPTGNQSRSVMATYYNSSLANSEYLRKFLYEHMPIFKFCFITLASFPSSIMELTAAYGGFPEGPSSKC